jgi:uncharacterized protein YdaU (DUF1376 family)
MHYYKRNLGDYAKKAGRLSMLQHGAFTLLIDACYDREQFPTLEEAIDWAWASSAAEIEAVEFVLRKFFVLEDGRYVQKRIQEEIDEYHKKAETNARIANEREAKRKGKPMSGARTVHEPCGSVDEAPPNQEPRTKNQEPRKENPNVAPPVGGTTSLLPPDIGEQVLTVFRYWQQVMESPRAVLDDKRRKFIKAALKDYESADLLSAIRGCAKSPFYMGKNDRKEKYNGIHLIFRSAEYIEKFIAADQGRNVHGEETDAQKMARMLADLGADDGMTIEMEVA